MSPARQAKPLRILLICYVYPPEVAPAGVMTRELAEDLTAAGHEVTVLTGWPNHPTGRLLPGFRMKWRHVERVDGYRLVRVGHSLPYPRTALRRILWWTTFGISSFVNILVGRRHDVVYAHSTPLVGSFLTALACRLKRSRFVFGIFDVHPEAAAEIGMVSPASRAYRLCRGLDTFTCRQAASIPTLCDGLRETIAARGIERSRIPIIPFWIDERRIVPGPRENDWSRRHALPADRFIVLYAGTIGNISGAAMMVDVADAMRGDNVLFLFVGEGAAKEDLRLGAARRGLRNMVFLPFQPDDQLQQMQASADIGLITLLPGAGRNSIPSKVLGYLSAGRGVLASVDPDSDTAACIRQGECGRVVPPQDAHALVDAIRDVMRPGVAERLGRAARRHFESCYSRSANTALYLNLLQDVCRRPGSRTP